MENLDVRVEELKLRMAVILPKLPRREKMSAALETFLTMHRTTGTTPGSHVLGGHIEVYEVIGKIIRVDLYP